MYLFVLSIRILTLLFFVFGFQGGLKHVELLNAVSRDNYTMITYKRPLKASDIYDVSISTLPKFEQNVFWSIGYKSSEMRKIHKPSYLR